MSLFEWVQWVAIGLALVLGGFGLPVAAIAFHRMREELAEHRDGHQHDMNEAAVTKILGYLDQEMRAGFIPVNDRIASLERANDQFIEKLRKSVDQPESGSSRWVPGGTVQPIRKGEEE